MLPAESTSLTSPLSGLVLISEGRGEGGREGGRVKKEETKDHVKLVVWYIRLTSARQRKRITVSANGVCAVVVEMISMQRAVLYT